jgi:UDP-N-acetylmuramate--alanine ligase
VADRDRLFETATRVHLVGAGGAGMSGLAKVLSQLGYRVSGSDLKPGRMLDALVDVGVETWVGSEPASVVAADLVVASSAVPETDPELTAAVASGIPVWRRPDLLAALTARMPALGFSGTHGKTTSSAMAVTALRGCGRDPSFVVGGELAALNTGAHLGDPDLFVLEADEAFGTFRRLDLTGLVVTNIEADHIDFYGSVAAMEDAYGQVALRVAGPVVACLDDPGVRRLGRHVDVVGYGTSPDAAWRVGELEHEPLAVAFSLTEPGGGVHRVAVPRPGTHIALDAAGVLALLGETGHDVAAAAGALADFAGVRRRFEVKARVEGITIVDDYAHHPTEVAATIAAGRHGAERRIWAVFQPHRYSRTADLAPAFGVPLASADRVVVTDVYAAGERPVPGVSGRLVADAVAAAGGTIDYVPRLPDVPAAIAGELVPGDLVLLLGAGDVASVSGELVTMIRESA